MYEVVLTFRPTRTREYTRTILDLVNDMFVPRTELAYVSIGYEAADAAGLRVAEELRDDSPLGREGQILAHEQTSREGRTWANYIRVAWDEAIETDTDVLRGITEGEPLPAVVYVLRRADTREAWGRKGQLYTVYKTVSVHTSRDAAQAALLRTAGPQEIIECDLMVSPVTVA